MVTPGLTPLPGPTLLPSVLRVLGPATGGLAADRLAPLAVGLTAARVVAAVLELAVLAALGARRVEVAIVVAAALVNVAEGLRVVVGTKPPGFLLTADVAADVDFPSDEPDTVRLAAGIAGEDGVFRLLTFILVMRGRPVETAVDSVGMEDTLAEGD